MFKYILILLSGVALSLVATPVVRRIAIGCGAIDVPGGRRIHSVPTPRFGGLAVHLAIIFGLAVAGLADSFVAATLLAHSAEVAGLFAATTVLTVVGLVDDRRSLRPTLKLAVEILAGIIAVAAGCRIDMVVRIDLGWFGPTATVFWIVAIINAVNMIDGLAAGAGLIISATLFSISLYLGNIESSFILAALSGALFGVSLSQLSSGAHFLGRLGKPVYWISAGSQRDSKFQQSRNGGGDYVATACFGVAPGRTCFDYAAPDLSCPASRPPGYARAAL